MTRALLLTLAVALAALAACDPVGHCPDHTDLTDAGICECTCGWWPDDAGVCQPRIERCDGDQPL